MRATAPASRTRQSACWRLDRNHASERARNCRSHDRASAQLSGGDYGARVGGSRFLETDPIEGGSANDYDYAAGDPINNLDLDGSRMVRRRAAGQRGAPACPSVVRLPAEFLSSRSYIEGGIALKNGESVSEAVRIGSGSVPSSAVNIGAGQVSRRAPSGRHFGFSSVKSWFGKGARVVGKITGLSVGVVATGVDYLCSMPPSSDGKGFSVSQGSPPASSDYLAWQNGR